MQGSEQMQSYTLPFCRMIVYNDQRSPAEIMHIILHELGHLKLHHTQQSINGEVEASWFAMVMSYIFMIEKRMHLGKAISKGKGRKYFLEGILDYYKC